MDCKIRVKTVSFATPRSPGSFLSDLLPYTSGRTVKHLIRFIAIALCLSALVACSISGNEPSANGSKPTRYLSQESVYSWFDFARTIVENDRGIDLSNVSISLLNVQQMGVALSDLYGKQADQSISYDTRMRLFAGSARRDANHLVALYDPYAKRIVMNRTILGYRIQAMKKFGISTRESVMPVILHELIHAADDKQFKLLTIEQSRIGDKLGIFFVAEGHAEMHTDRLCAKAGCSEALAATTLIGQHPDTPKDPLYIVGPLLQRNSLIYKQGKEFMTALSRRDPTGALVETVMKDPPGDVYEFFSPEEYPNTARTKRRTAIFSLLQNLNLHNDAYATLKIPEAGFDLLDLPNGKHPQRHHMMAYGEKIIASGAMHYFNQQDPDSRKVTVTIYQGSSTDALLEKKQNILDKHLWHARTLMQVGVGVHHPGPSVLDKWSEGIPSNTQQYAVQLTQTGSGQSLTLFSSLLIEGDFLIAVTNFNDNELNNRALTKIHQAIKNF